MYKYMNLWKLCAPDPEGGAGGGQDPEGGTEPKTFTQDDVDKIVQARIAKERKAFDAQIEKAKKEAEENARLSAEELAKKKSEEAAQQLAQREAEITKRERRASALETLGTKKLSAELADVLDYSSDDALTASIEKLEKSFNAAVQKAVDDKLKGSTPPSGGAGNPDPVADFRKAIGLKN